MPRQPVISVTITADMPYDKKTFGSIGKAEEAVTDFMDAARELASEHGLTWLDAVAKHSSVEKK